MILFGMAASASVVLLALSLNPGYLAEQSFFLSLFLPLVLLAMPVLVLFGLIGARPLSRLAWGRWLLECVKRLVLSNLQWRWLVATVVTVVVTLVLIENGLIQRLAFAVSRPSFAGLVDQSPTGKVGLYGRDDDRHRLGLFTCDGHFRDPRGGVYFRTYRGPGAGFLQTISEGFAFQPNPEGSPFGDTEYSLKRISGDWSWFQTIDNW